MICEKTGAETVPPKMGVGRSRTTIIDSVGIGGGSKSDERRHVCPGDIGVLALGRDLRRPGLAGDGVTRDGGAGPGALVDHLLEHRGDLRVDRGRQHLMGRRRSGLRDRARRADPGLHELRSDVNATVGDGVVGIENLQRTDGVDLADRKRHIVRRFPLRRRGEQARRLAGEVEPGRLPETQQLHLGEQPLLPHALRDLRGADIGGLGEDLRRRQLLGGMRLRVMERRAVELQLVGDGEDSVRVDQRVLQGGRERHQLEHRARLVKLGHGEVARCLVHRVAGADGHDAPWGVRRCRRRTDRRGMGRDEVRHRENLARLHVHDDGRAADGVRRFDRLGQCLLGLVLELRVDGELQSRPRSRRHLVRHRRLRESHAAG